MRPRIVFRGVLPTVEYLVTQFVRLPPVTVTVTVVRSVVVQRVQTLTVSVRREAPIEKPAVVTVLRVVPQTVTVVVVRPEPEPPRLPGRPIPL